MTEKRTISILGSTGSIGVQAIDVLGNLTDSFELAYLTANTNIALLAAQASALNPLGIVISDEKSYYEFKQKYSFGGKILCGEEGVCEAAGYDENDLIIQALVGFSGVKPTLAAIENGIEVALANKETLVSAGSIVTEAAEKYGIRLLAIDSEHSAVLQSIVGEEKESIEKIILTASGGPFREMSIDELVNVRPADALSHPNWSMGNKITIDSATMMNKGFEVIEAYWLFGMDSNQIDIVIHPQSIVHSLVQFVDGSVKAQLGLPDMRIPISYALSYPVRLSYDFPRLDLAEISKLEFYKPDYDKFPCIKLAYEAIDTGGTAPAIINAANEIAVRAFLDNKIRFVSISDSIKHALDNTKIINNPDIDEIVNTDLQVRKLTKDFITSLM